MDVYVVYMRHLVALADSVTTAVAGDETFQRDRWVSMVSINPAQFW